MLEQQPAVRIQLHGPVLENLDDHLVPLAGLPLGPQVLGYYLSCYLYSTARGAGGKGDEVTRVQDRWLRIPQGGQIPGIGASRIVFDPHRGPHLLVQDEKGRAARGEDPPLHLKAPLHDSPAFRQTLTGEVVGVHLDPAQPGIVLEPGFNPARGPRPRRQE